MSITDRSGAGAAPNLMPGFNPLVFRDSLTVSRWPMMGSTSTNGFPRMSPQASMGASHTDHSDEASAQVTAQYTVINSPGSRFPSSMLTACDLTFRTQTPMKPNQLLNANASTPVLAFTLSMMNVFLRARHAEAAETVKTKSGRPFDTAAVQAVIGTPAEYDIIDAYLRMADDKHPSEKAAAATPITLTDSEKLDMHYLFPRGVMKRIRYLGPSMAQSNTLYTPGPDVSSISGDCGQTLLSIGFSGPAIVRNFWGPRAIVGKHLWLICKPLEQDGAPQFVPYVSDSFDNNVPYTERTYTNAVGKQEVGVLVYIGQVLITTGNRDLAQSVYSSAAGLGSKDIEGRKLGMSFTDTEMLPLLTIMVHPRRWGTYDIKAN